MIDTNLYDTANYVKALIFDVGIELKHIFIDHIKHTRLQKLHSRFKNKGELVTYADELANTYIIKQLTKRFPYYSIYSEETPTKDLEGLHWIIDPLDGTTNFVMGNPFWNTAIALADNQNKEILIGIIYAPMLDKLYLAIKNKGAFINKHKLNLSNITPHKDVTKALNTFCHGSSKQAKLRAAKYYQTAFENGFIARQLGSAQLELAYIAEGLIHTMFIAEGNTYDYAAAALVIKEAGGTIFDQYFTPWTYTHEENKDIIAGINQELLYQLKKYLPLLQK